MIAVRLTEAGELKYCCQIANQTLSLDYLPAELAPFQVTREADCKSSSDTRPELILGTEDFISVRGWIHTEECLIRRWANKDSYLIDVDIAGRFAISAAGEHIIHLDAGQIGITPSSVIFALIGPALYISLALHEIFCLHASALRIGDHAIAFVGHSEAGKSTLARFLGQSDSEWELIADDILPITQTERITALPHFPQHRLAFEEQVSTRGVPKALPLTAIYKLDSTSNHVFPNITELDARNATRALLFETVGASLFAKELLMRHLSFLIEVQKRIPVKRLVYPHRREALPIIKWLIEQDIT